MGKSFDIKNLDWYLISIVMMLIFSGMVVIYSATNAMGSDSMHTFYRQILWFGIGLVFAVIMYLIPTKILFALAYVLYTFSVVLLTYVLFQDTGSSLERWINIGGISFQPSEFAKLAVVLALARFLSQSKIEQNKLKDFLVVLLLIAVPVYLVKEQPDLGTSLVFLSLIIPMLYWAGIQSFTLFVLISPFVSILASSNKYFFLLWMLIVVGVLYYSKKTLIVILGLFILNISVGVMTPYIWNKLEPYQQQRLLSVLDPSKDPQGSGYQVLQSLNAIGSGGISGKGFMKGTQTQLRFLPEQHTDFIFSVLGEEFGFIGISIILLLFFLLIVRLITIATRVKNRFDCLIVTGFASILLFHVLVNTGMTVGIMPVTGLPLPYLSSGGSFLISTMGMTGLVLNVAYSK
ncbi:rod shape-determining protein RodA [candidate division KSB1 bacterium]